MAAAPQTSHKANAQHCAAQAPRPHLDAGGGLEQLPEARRLAQLLCLALLLLLLVLLLLALVEQVLALAVRDSLRPR
jgi:hypothetical protein